MSTTPFRVAFWALSLAFGMTVIMVLPNPERIRVALRAQRQPSIFRHEQALLTELTGNAPASSYSSGQTASPGRAMPSDGLPGRAPAPHNVQLSDTNPVRVALADPFASLGLDGNSAAVASAQHSADGKSSPQEQVTSDRTSISIPVPDPLGHTGRASPQTHLPDRQPIPGRSVHEVAAAVRGSSMAGHIGPAADATSGDEFFGPGIEVHAADTPEHWTFRFENAPLAAVLEMLGARAGWPVVTDPEIDETCSGHFIDVDAAQAFALVIKTHHCSVTRRGAVVLVGKRDRAAHR